MTDLDRKIAELKGMTPDSVSRVDGSPIYWSLAESAWSDSDAKALELVDELGMQFRLEGNPGHWSAVFDVYGQHHVEGGATRPEAICRAYIAAMEWLKATAATPPPAPPARP